MKKLFVCAMALAAFVSCSKDDVAQEPVLDSVNKSIAITIANGSAATRGDAGHTTAATADSQIAVANANDLMIFFATTDGTILEYKKLVGTEDDHKDPGTSDPQYAYGSTTATGTSGAAINGDYIFHNVPAAVTKVAIARYEGEGTEKADITIVKGSTNISELDELASNAVLNEQREIDDICLYGYGTLGAKGNTCVTYNGIEYHVYPVSVTVTPKLARLEINNIECLNLGVANDDSDITTFGIDKLQLLSLGWGGTTTTGEGEDAVTSYVYNIPAADFNNVVLHGTYKAGGTTAANATDDVKGDNAYKCPTSNKVWSWNVPTDAVVPSTTNPMILGLYATAYDYTLADSNVQLKVVGLSEGETAVEAFEAANIYQLNLQFNEGDIAGQEGVCVNVTVTISPWTVNTVKATFGK